MDGAHRTENQASAASEHRSAGQRTIGEIQRRVLEWYRTAARDLPWRRTRDPYRILVSEVMLQQTQAERVIPSYERFVARFPTFEALADAPLAEVIAQWEGLGYNRRAVYLWRTAREVTQRYGGILPRERQALQRLPGIGRYTAGAVACFAFGEPVAFWDTNIARVLTRIFLGPEARPSARELDALADQTLPTDHAYEWNQALMELGAVVCLVRRPRCGICPVSDSCRSAGTTGGPRRRGERFEGSRRYYRGRIVRALRQVRSGLPLDELGRIVRADYTPEQRDWLEQIVAELARDGLVEAAEERGTAVVRLPGCATPAGAAQPSAERD